MERWCWVREHVKTSLLWTTIKHLWAEGTATRSQLHCSHSPSGQVCPAHTQRRLESGTKLMSVTQEPEVCVLPGKGLGKSLLKSSNMEGKGIILHSLSPQYIFLYGFRTDRDVPKCPCSQVMHLYPEHSDWQSCQEYCAEDLTSGVKGDDRRSGMRSHQGPSCSGSLGRYVLSPKDVRRDAGKSLEISF